MGERDSLQHHKQQGELSNQPVVAERVHVSHHAEDPQPSAAQAATSSFLATATGALSTARLPEQPDRLGGPASSSSPSVSAVACSVPAGTSPDSSPGREHACRSGGRDIGFPGGPASILALAGAGTAAGRATTSPFAAPLQVPVVAPSYIDTAPALAVEHAGVPDALQPGPVGGACLAAVRGGSPTAHQFSGGLPLGHHPLQGPSAQVPGLLRSQSPLPPHFSGGSQRSTPSPRPLGSPLGRMLTASPQMAGVPLVGLPVLPVALLPPLPLPPALTLGGLAVTTTMNAAAVAPAVPATLARARSGPVGDPAQQPQPGSATMAPRSIQQLQPPFTVRTSCDGRDRGQGQLGSWVEGIARRSSPGAVDGGSSGRASGNGCVVSGGSGKADAGGDFMEHPLAQHRSRRCCSGEAAEEGVGARDARVALEEAAVALSEEGSGDQKARGPNPSGAVPQALPAVPPSGSSGTAIMAGLPHLPTCAAAEAGPAAAADGIATVSPPVGLRMGPAATAQAPHAPPMVSGQGTPAEAAAAARWTAESPGLATLAAPGSNRPMPFHPIRPIPVRFDAGLLRAIMAAQDRPGAAARVAAGGAAARTAEDSGHGGHSAAGPGREPDGAVAAAAAAPLLPTVPPGSAAGTWAGHEASLAATPAQQGEKEQPQGPIAAAVVIAGAPAGLTAAAPHGPAPRGQAPPRHPPAHRDASESSDGSGGSSGVHSRTEGRNPQYALYGPHGYYGPAGAAGAPTALVTDEPAALFPPDADGRAQAASAGVGVQGGGTAAVAALSGGASAQLSSAAMAMRFEVPLPTGLLGSMQCLLGFPPLNQQQQQQQPDSHKGRPQAPPTQRQLPPGDPGPCDSHPCPNTMEALAAFMSSPPFPFAPWPGFPFGLPNAWPMPMQLMHPQQQQQQPLQAQPAAAPQQQVLQLQAQDLRHQVPLQRPEAGCLPDLCAYNREVEGHPVNAPAPQQQQQQQPEQDRKATLERPSAQVLCPPEGVVLNAAASAAEVHMHGLQAGRPPLRQSRRDQLHELALAGAVPPAPVCWDLNLAPAGDRTAGGAGLQCRAAGEGSCHAQHGHRGACRGHGAVELARTVDGDGGGGTAAAAVAGGGPNPRRRATGSSAAAASGRPVRGSAPPLEGGGTGGCHTGGGVNRHGAQRAMAGAPEGGYKYIVQVGDKWRAQVGHMEGGVQRKYYSSYVRSPLQAACDADKLLYKLRGPAFPLNFPLPEAARRALDGMSLQELLHQLHPTQDQPALMAAAALLDLSRHSSGDGGRTGAGGFGSNAATGPQPAAPGRRPDQTCLQPQPPSTLQAPAPLLAAGMAAGDSEGLTQGSGGPPGATLQGSVAGSPSNAGGAAVGGDTAAGEGGGCGGGAAAVNGGMRSGASGTGGPPAPDNGPGRPHACGLSQVPPGGGTGAKAVVGALACCAAAAADTAVNDVSQTGAASGIACRDPGRMVAGAGTDRLDPSCRDLASKAVAPAEALRGLKPDPPAGGESGGAREQPGHRDGGGPGDEGIRRVAAARRPTDGRTVSDATSNTVGSACADGGAEVEEVRSGGDATTTTPVGDLCGRQPACRASGHGGCEDVKTGALALRAELLAAGEAAPEAGAAKGLTGEVKSGAAAAAVASAAAAAPDAGAQPLFPGFLPAAGFPFAFPFPFSFPFPMHMAHGLPMPMAAMHPPPLAFQMAAAAAAAAAVSAAAAAPSALDPSDPEAGARCWPDLGLLPLSWPPGALPPPAPSSQTRAQPAAPGKRPSAVAGALRAVGGGTPWPASGDRPAGPFELDPPQAPDQLRNQGLGRRSDGLASGGPSSGPGGPALQRAGHKNNRHGSPASDASTGGEECGEAGSRGSRGSGGGDSGDGGVSGGRWAHVQDLARRQRAAAGGRCDGGKRAAKKPCRGQNRHPPPRHPRRHPHHNPQQHYHQQQEPQSMQPHVYAERGHQHHHHHHHGLVNPSAAILQCGPAAAVAAAAVAAVAAPTLPPGVVTGNSRLAGGRRARKRKMAALAGSGSGSGGGQSHAGTSGSDGENGAAAAAVAPATAAVYGNGGKAGGRGVGFVTGGGGPSTYLPLAHLAPSAAQGADRAAVSAFDAGGSALEMHVSQGIAACGAAKPQRQTPSQQPGRGQQQHPHQHAERERLPGPAAQKAAPQAASMAAASVGGLAAAAAATGAPERPPYRYIVRIGSKWRAQVGHTEDGVQRKYYSNYVDDPRVAAKDADRILYKLRGSAAVANLPLSNTERAALDAITLEALLRSFKSDQRQQQQQQQQQQNQQHLL